MDFQGRYNALNKAQKQAVDQIDGPVMVVAGPGTGKTELLSMRAANILQKTDTLPENILCLTFTDSGADAMRNRLMDIIGQDGYKVAVHTFHSFGSDVINQYNEYFYRGAEFQAADELTRYEILRGIFDELDYTNPLTSKLGGEYVHLKDSMTVISELKKSGLTTSELLRVLDANDEIIEKIEPSLASVFSSKISASTLELLLPVASELAKLPLQALPANVTPLAPMIALGLSDAITDAQSTKSTKPITAWKKQWLEKDDDGNFVLKSRKRQSKLRAAAIVYDMYLTRMEDARLYDFDDMILQIVHAMETQPDLKYNLQEKFQYIMVDEFQDTNMAQARILYNLTDNESSNGRPNIMVVGDDDQAIYSFQGADVSNILNFQQRFEATELITLKENYRSTQTIIDAAREIITQGENRLENHIDSIDKTLHSNLTAPASVELRTYDSQASERAATVADIARQRGKDASKSIAVFARRHSELLDLLPYFANANIPVTYEKWDNVLDDDVIILVEHIANIVLALAEKRHDEADELLPELLAHKAWNFGAEDVWKLSLSAYQNHRLWLEEMAATAAFQPLWKWLVALSHAVMTTPLERLLDIIIGNEPLSEEYMSPLYDFYFSELARHDDPEAYVQYLENLRTIRGKLREYQNDTTPTLKTFVEFIELHRVTDTRITTLVQRGSSTDTDRVQLMTAHKSKGLEFDHVYLTGAVDTTWGEKVRSRSRHINYPENLPLAPSGSNLDERLRLFFVAMTRAKTQLIITHANSDPGGKELRQASFLMQSSAQSSEESVASDSTLRLEAAKHDWYAPLVQPISGSMSESLAPTLARYKLSATHLNNFLDVTRGGPQTFLLHNLLRFPSAMSPAAAYGSAIHATLQRAHTHLKATGDKQPQEDILQTFEQQLASAYLTTAEFDEYLQKGCLALQAFLAANYDSFTPDQKTELSFGNQQVVIGEAKLTGALDLVDSDDGQKTIIVTDYKTGKPSLSWQGKTDYEKRKLHKYKQQLMFYKLLIENSRDFGSYTVESGVLQFVEPTKSGVIVALDMAFSQDEIAQFSKLVEAVWKCIMTLDFPDTSQYGETYKGVVAFEADLRDKYVDNEA